MPKKNWLEWTVFGLSAVIILAVVAVLAFEAATVADSPPQLSISLGDAVTQPAGYSIPLTVENTGGNTAENVNLELTIEHNGETETGECQIAFVPRQSSGECWVMLSENPQDGEVKARVLGFEQP